MSQYDDEVPSLEQDCMDAAKEWKEAQLERLAGTKHMLDSLFPTKPKLHLAEGPEDRATEALHVASTNLKMAVALAEEAGLKETATYLRLLVGNLEPAFDALKLEVGLVYAQNVMGKNG